MKKQVKKTKPSKLSTPSSIALRQRAEAQLKKQAGRHSEQDAKRTLHELQVHQIELEMQNDELKKANIKMNAVWESYAELYDFAPLPYLTVGRDSLILNANNAAVLLLGKVYGTLCTLRLGAFVSDEALPTFNAFLDKAFASSEKQSCETKLLVDGNMLSVIIHTSLNQQETNLLVEIVDVTEHKQTEKSLLSLGVKLDLERLQLQRVLAGAELGFWDWDIATGKVERNERWAVMLGYTYDEIKQTTHQWADFVHPEDRMGAWQSINDVIEGRSKVHSLEYRMLNKDGGYIWIYDQASVVERNSTGKPLRMSGTHSDITERKEYQSQLEHNAHYDLLTDLPNRILLADRLSQSMLQCGRHNLSLAVLFLDLDGFKAVNDTHGHNVGDQLLIAISQRMKEALREGDTLSRFGGDEFVVVLADLAKVEECKPLLERFLLAASEPVTIGDVVLNISASIGVTFYPQDSATANQLMRHADQSMYVAKESGKNRYHIFDTAQSDTIKVQRENLEAIRTALDNHQFVLHYQPKVNMRTGQIIGFEALIRWQHPKRGLLASIEFLPAIENTPISIEIGEWVIDTTLTQISQWQKMGIGLPRSTSVNIAAAQLQQPDFTERLEALLAAHPDVEPRHLELEVLETSALSSISQVSATMNACHKRGVRFALDDFGTGYSSLTHLRQLPAYLIKIDRSFVRGILENPDDLAIVESIIALATSFKCKVIAEGVETIDHGTVLLKLGCKLAQGYGIAKPMPATDIPAWVSNWKPDKAWIS